MSEEDQQDFEYAEEEEQQEQDMEMEQEQEPEEQEAEEQQEQYEEEEEVPEEETEPTETTEGQEEPEEPSEEYIESPRRAEDEPAAAAAALPTKEASMALSPITSAERNCLSSTPQLHT